MNWFYYVGRALTRFVLLFIHWEVTGRENIPATGPVLVVCNHLSVTDPPILSVTFKRRNVFMAKEELFRSKFNAYFMRGFGAFPVYRTHPTRETLDKARDVLAQGLIMIMFPEGKRSSTRKLLQGFPGSAFIAAQCNVPILPVGITGSERISGVAWLPHRPRVTVNIGRPFRLPPTNGKLSKTELAEFTATIMERIAELLPADYGGKLESN